MRRSRCRACCRCRWTIISPRIFRARCFSMSMRSRTTTIRGRICFRTRSSSRATSPRSAFPPAIPSVAYDSGGWVAAPRAWWMFLSFGHPECRSARRRPEEMAREGRPTHSGKVTPKPGKFKAKFDPSYVRSQQQMIGNIETPGRAGDRCAAARAFRGTVGRAAAGAALAVTSPAAAACPMPNLFDAATGAMKPLDELRKAFIERRRRHDASRS